MFKAKNGIKKKTKAEVVIEIRIPTHLGPPTLANTLPCSFYGRNFSVVYNLICFVKHDSWNDFGEGKRVIMPVKIA